MSLETLKDNYLSKAFDQVMSKTALPFPLSGNGKISEDAVREPINCMYVSKMLF